MLKQKKLISLLLSLALAMSFALVGCGGSSEPSDSTDSTGSDEPANTEIKLVKDGVLTVGSDCNYPPFIEMDGDKPAGFEYDLIKAIADEMGYELEFLPPQNFDGLLTALASNSLMDISMSVFTITDERKELVDFTVPYCDSNQAVVVLTDSGYTSAEDLDGMVVGAQSGTTGADWVNENLGATTTLKEFTDVTEVMSALATGDIKGAFYDEPVASFLTNTQYPDAHIVEVIPTGEQYGIAVSKDNPALLEALNEAMKNIKKNGVFDEIFLSYFPDVTPPSLGV